MIIGLRCPLCNRGVTQQVPKEWTYDELFCRRCFPAPQEVRMARYLIYRKAMESKEKPGES